MNPLSSSLNSRATSSTPATTAEKQRAQLTALQARVAALISQAPIINQPYSNTPPAASQIIPPCVAKAPTPVAAPAPAAAIAVTAPESNPAPSEELQQWLLSNLQIDNITPIFDSLITNDIRNLTDLRNASPEIEKAARDKLKQIQQRKFNRALSILRNSEAPGPYPVKGPALLQSQEPVREAVPAPEVAVAASDADDAPDLKYLNLSSNAFKILRERENQFLRGINDIQSEPSRLHKMTPKARNILSFSKTDHQEESRKIQTLAQTPGDRKLPSPTPIKRSESLQCQVKFTAVNMHSYENPQAVAKEITIVAEPGPVKGPASGRRK